MDDNLSKVYAKSAKSKQDYCEYPEVLREAVSLGKLKKLHLRYTHLMHCYLNFFSGEALASMSTSLNSPGSSSHESSSSSSPVSQVQQPSKYTDATMDSAARNLLQMKKPSFSSAGMKSEAKLE